jgi:Na+/H+-dicarboxylate symporter
VLNAVGLPVEAVGLILAVDRILDMCRTSINVWSDSVATAVVSRFAEPPGGGGNVSGDEATG